MLNDWSTRYQWQCEAHAAAVAERDAEFAKMTALLEDCREGRRDGLRPADFQSWLHATSHVREVEDWLESLLRERICK